MSGARWTAPDGVAIFYEDQPGPTDALPVVCLPGLTRSARDFDALAAHLAGARRVIRPEMRGRGRSDRADPATYTLPVEVGDILGLLASLGVARAIFVGTSRGGLQTMALAAANPALVAGAALNDIGPEIGPEGMARIVDGLTRAPDSFPDWAAAAEALRATYGAEFTDLSDAQWAGFARQLFVERDGRPARDYDPALVAATAAAVAAGEAALKAAAEAGQPAPDLWPLFDALKPVPALAIRGANSALLTAETLTKMAARKPDLAVLTLPNRGHAPFLDEPQALAAIDALLARAA